MKIIEADAGYEVLDRLIAKIQKNGYKTTQEMLDDAHKEWCGIQGIIHLRHIGRDSHDRPVYEDADGKLWKDVEPRADRPAKLCSTLYNSFDGEPDAPMEYIEQYQGVKIRYMPKRDIW